MVWVVVLLVILSLLGLFWLLFVTQGVYLGQRYVRWFCDHVLAAVYDWFLTEQRDEEMLDLIRRADIHSGQRVLDIACGTGQLLELVNAHYGNDLLVGLDFSIGMLKKAQKRARALEKPSQLSFINQTASQLPFAAAAFDVVACTGPAVQILPDPQQSLHEMRRVLKPGGRLVLSALPSFVGRMMLPGRDLDAERLKTLLEQMAFKGVEIQNWRPAEHIVLAQK